MKNVKLIFTVCAFLTLLSFTQLKAQYDNSPSNDLVIPEAVWALATGGGTWETSLQITCHSSGTGGTVWAYFLYGDGNFAGPVTIWTDPTSHASVYYSNILSYMDGIDTSFSYFGHSGSMNVFATEGITITTVARVYNGNYSKTMPGLNDVDSNSVSLSRVMAVLGLASNATYRSTLGLVNPGVNPLTVNIYVVNASGTSVGSLIERTVPGYGFIALNPFVECGLPYPATSYDFITIEIWPVSGTGRLMAFGASTNNTTNDSGAHIAVNWQ
jgi:hypothetical protein